MDTKYEQNNNNKEKKNFKNNNSNDLNFPVIDKSPAYMVQDNVVPLNLNHFQKETNIKTQNINVQDLQNPNYEIFWKIINNSTIYEIIPKSNKVIVLDVELKVKHAFEILHSCGI